MSYPLRVVVCFSALALGVASAAAQSQTFHFGEGESSLQGHKPAHKTRPAQRRTRERDRSQPGTHAPQPNNDPHNQASQLRQNG